MKKRITFCHYIKMADWDDVAFVEIEHFLFEEDEILNHGITVKWSMGRIVLDVPYPQGDWVAGDMRSALILRCEQIHEAVGTAQLAGMLE